MLTLDAFASWSSVIGFGGAVLAVAIRYGRGDEVERHQLKWLIAVALVAAVAFPFAFIVPESFGGEIAFLVGLLALMALPIAIAIAILRYRLYNIDRIISRTIGWTLVSGLLVASFAVLVVGLQAVLAGVTQGETLAVAASTLVASALFQPVRRTVQRAVDRRFDRARYDAQRTAEMFAERLRTRWPASWSVRSSAPSGRPRPHSGCPDGTHGEHRHLSRPPAHERPPHRGGGSSRSGRPQPVRCYGPGSRNDVCTLTREDEPDDRCNAPVPPLLRSRRRRRGRGDARSRGRSRRITTTSPSISRSPTRRLPIFGRHPARSISAASSWPPRRSIDFVRPASCSSSRSSLRVS